MSIYWPTSLQSLLSEDSFSISEGDTILRSEMGVGPAKVRRKYTKGIDEVSGSITLSSSDYITFKDFYRSTLAGGSLPFKFNHPITQVETDFRFKNSPNYQSIGGGYFKVSFNWEEI